MSKAIYTPKQNKQKGFFFKNFQHAKIREKEGKNATVF